MAAKRQRKEKEKEKGKEKEKEMEKKEKEKKEKEKGVRNGACYSFFFQNELWKNKTALKQSLCSQAVSRTLRSQPTEKSLDCQSKDHFPSLSLLYFFLVKTTQENTH